MTLHLLPIQPVITAVIYDDAGTPCAWAIRSDIQQPMSGAVWMHRDGRYIPVDCDGREMPLTLSLQRAAMAVVECAR